MTSDSERAVMNTKEKTINHSATSLHHNQAICANIQLKGHQALLNNSTKFMYFFKMLHGLSFAPPEQDDEHFREQHHGVLGSNQDVCRRVSPRWQRKLRTLWPNFCGSWMRMIAGHNKADRSPLCAISSWNKFEDILAILR
jgi:hypothetical protein